MCMVGRVWWLVSGSRYLLTHRKAGTFAAWPQRVDLRNMPPLAASLLLLCNHVVVFGFLFYLPALEADIRCSLSVAESNESCLSQRCDRCITWWKKSFLQCCLIWMSRDYLPNWRDAGTPKWNADIFRRTRTHTCFDSMKASVTLYSRADFHHLSFEELLAGWWQFGGMIGA